MPPLPLPREPSLGTEQHTLAHEALLSLSAADLSAGGHCSGYRAEGLTEARPALTANLRGGNIPTLQARWLRLRDGPCEVPQPHVELRFYVGPGTANARSLRSQSLSHKPLPVCSAATRCQAQNQTASPPTPGKSPKHPLSQLLGLKI